MSNTFLVGYNRQTVNPDEPVPLAGYVNDSERYHETVAEDICATCVAMSDGENTILVIGFDVTVAGTEFSQILRTRLNQLTGIPEDRIYLAGTHTHAGPGLGEQELQFQFPAIQRYWVKFSQGVCDAAEAAIRDLKPARIFTGSIETEHLNFIKHYKARDKETGAISYLGDVFGSQQGKVLLDHATQIDPTLHMVKFLREGGKPVILSNFRGHPHFDGGAKRHFLSSDYIGAYRRALEAMIDCHVLYLQGASGNVNTSSRMEDEKHFTTRRSHGLALAAYGAECLEKYMTEVEPGPIRTKQVAYYGDPCVVTDEQVEAAKGIVKLWEQTYDAEYCKPFAEAVGLRSSYHALAIIGNADRPKEDYRMILNAVAIGDFLSFVTFPGELFDSLSAYVEATSPFNTTLVLGYAHHQVGYLPNRTAFKYSSYEANITRFACGTGEKVAQKYVEMLCELANRT